MVGSSTRGGGPFVLAIRWRLMHAFDLHRAAQPKSPRRAYRSQPMLSAIAQEQGLHCDCRRASDAHDVGPPLRDGRAPYFGYCR